MKKFIKNVFLMVSLVVVAALTVLFLSHDSPIPIEVPHVSLKEMAAQKEASEKAARAAERQARAKRIYSCTADADCLIVAKDPCGCSAGPEGVVAINGKYIPDFNAINIPQSMTQSCSEAVSRERECSPSARPVCQANVCKIVY